MKVFVCSLPSVQFIEIQSEIYLKNDEAISSNYFLFTEN